MSVRNNVTLSERYLHYAERLVADGQFLSIDKVVEAGIDSLMRHGDDAAAGAQDPLAPMAEEIRRRMQTPRDQFIAMDKDNLFDRVRARLEEKYKAR